VGGGGGGGGGVWGVVGGVGGGVGCGGAGVCGRVVVGWGQGSFRIAPLGKARQRNRLHTLERSWLAPGFVQSELDFPY